MIEINQAQQSPCDRCSVLLTNRKSSFHHNNEDTNIFTINTNNNTSQYLQLQNSQFSSRQSTNINGYNSSNLGNSYLAKRTGLSKAGMSILNLQNMNNSSTQGLNDSRLQTRNSSMQPAQYNKSNNNSFIFTNNLSTNNSSQLKSGYGSAFQSQSHLKNSEYYQMNQAANQECLCLGSIKPYVYRWKKEDVNMIDLSNTEIVIIHSDDIKVHYSSENEAKLLGLWNEQLSSKREKNGEIFSQTGLKGDAKALYLDIKKGYEQRVRLLQTSDEYEINQIINQSFMCIDATGYINTAPLIKGVQGEVYEPKKDSNSMTQIDSKQRIITEKGPLKHIFCMGFFSGVSLSEFEEGNNQYSDQRVHNINAYNDIESKRVCSSVLEALQNQDSTENWKWIEEVTLSQSQIFNNQAEPDYESANIMNFFQRDDELGIDKINKQLKKAKVGINFRGVDSYLHKKYKLPF